MADIDLAGAVDLHVHAGPSPFERRFDGEECAREAAAAGMDAVVLKEHFFPTAYGVPYVDRLLDRADADVTVVGSLVCNYCNGGFNPFAVQTAIDYGAGVVWGPTVDARHHAERTGSLGAFLGVKAGEEYADKSGVTALGDDEDLTPDVRSCVRKVAENDVVLCLGHLSYEETAAVVEYAADLGHEKVVVDHPNYHVTDLDVDQQRALVDRGACVNFPYLAISPEYGWITPGDLYDNVRALGVDNCVVSSDVGQPENPGVPESLRRLGEALVDEGLSESEYRRMVADAPRRLLGL